MKELIGESSGGKCNRQISLVLFCADVTPPCFFSGMGDAIDDREIQSRDNTLCRKRSSRVILFLFRQLKQVTPLNSLSPSFPLLSTSFPLLSTSLQRWNGVFSFTFDASGINQLAAINNQFSTREPEVACQTKNLQERVLAIRNSVMK